ncbi:hypothetical protein DEO72_LG2g443 [Vigna unguiculata]|uniref:Uncharacterized protein n=1 Tax=Vigna unguiculata TaxID=3917 RepID=A0A4D6L019_VIGUN|nr:hypothetical protein DEO72_LG2g443 [Vigna unguiculata]
MVVVLEVSHVDARRGRGELHGNWRDLFRRFARCVGCWFVVNQFTVAFPLQDTTSSSSSFHRDPGANSAASRPRVATTPPSSVTESAALISNRPLTDLYHGTRLDGATWMEQKERGVNKGTQHRRERTVQSLF